MRCRPQTRLSVTVVLLFVGCLSARADDKRAKEVEVPAFTAYVVPDNGAARIDPRRGITGWVRSDAVIKSYVNLKATGRLSLELLISLPDSDSATIGVKLAGKEFVREVKKTGADQYVRVPVGTVEISKPGYQAITLTGRKRTGRSFGSVKSLVFSGPASRGMHFNTKPRRNAASVHLWFPFPKGEQVGWFYNEITVPRGADPVHSYYMACGFSRGYFGIQVNSPTERRVIFSIWDSGNEAVDRKKVKPADRVTLLGKGRGVVAHGFGNEGTGGHSHWVHPWKAGTTQRFLVHAEPKGPNTTYTAYFFLPAKKKWKLIASFRAPKDGKHLRSLYSFIENFGGSSGYLRRQARFSRQWVRGAKGKWLELTQTRFTHDPTGRVERKDYGGGVEADGGFYLSNGGFLPATARYGDTFRRPATKSPPRITLPLRKSDLAE